MGGVPLVLGLLLFKTAAYAAWCRIGLRRLAAPPPLRPWRWALLLAAGRVGAGLGAGIALSALLMGPSEKYGRLGFNPFVWLGGLAVLRWVLWSAASCIIQRKFRTWLVPSSRRDVAWRAGGWLLSLVGDGLALACGIALGGLPC